MPGTAPRTYATVGVAVFPFVKALPVKGRGRWTVLTPSRKVALPVAFLSADEETLTGGAFVDGVVEFLDPAAVSRARRSLNGVVELRYDGKPVGTLQVDAWHARPPVAAAPALMDWNRAAAAAAEQMVALAARTAVRLDYSARSLAAIDDLFAGRARRAARETNRRLLMAGCYVGEVIRRRLGGSWVLLRPADPLPMLRLQSGAVCNPIGKVAALGREGAAESVAFFFTALKGTVSRPPTRRR